MHRAQPFGYLLRLVDLDFADMRPLSSAMHTHLHAQVSSLSSFLTHLGPGDTRQVLFKMRGVSCGAYRLVEAAQVPHSLAAAAIHHIRQPWLGIQAATVLSLLPKATPLLWLMSSTPPFVSMEVTLCAQSCVHNTRFSHFLWDLLMKSKWPCMLYRHANSKSFKLPYAGCLCAWVCPYVTIEIKKILITGLIGCLSGGFISIHILTANILRPLHHLNLVWIMIYERFIIWIMLTCFP